MLPSVPYVGGIAAAQAFAQNAPVCDSPHELEGGVLEEYASIPLCQQRAVVQRCAATQGPDHRPVLEREPETTVVIPVEYVHSRFEVGPSSHAWFTNLFTTRHNEKV